MYKGNIVYYIQWSTIQSQVKRKSCRLQQVREKQIPHGMTYMWNVKNKESKHDKTETDSSIQKTNW